MKNFKKIFSLLMILMLSVCMVFSLVSCGETEGGNGDSDGGDENKDTKITYTVTVTDDSGKAISGVKVQLLLDGVAPVGSDVQTDADGKATFKVKNEGNYYAKITSASADYIVSAAPTKLVDKAATIVLQKLPTYTVYVKDASGNAIQGAAVQICSVSSGACQLPKMTDAEGKIVSALQSDDYKAKVVSAPAGYTVVDEYFTIVDGSVTIVLESAN